MKFEMQHLFFVDVSIEFTEKDPPEYFKSGDFKWFFDEKVLELEIGSSILTDFQRITRIN